MNMSSILFWPSLTGCFDELLPKESIGIKIPNGSNPNDTLKQVLIKAVRSGRRGSPWVYPIHEIRQTILNGLYHTRSMPRCCSYKNPVWGNLCFQETQSKGQKQLSECETRCGTAETGNPPAMSLTPYSTPAAGSPQEHATHTKIEFPFYNQHTRPLNCKRALYLAVPPSTKPTTLTSLCDT